MFTKIMGKNKQTEKDQLKRSIKRQGQEGNAKSVTGSFVVIKNIIYTDTMDDIN